MSQANWQTIERLYGVDVNDVIKNIVNYTTEKYIDDQEWIRIAVIRGYVWGLEEKEEAFRAVDAKKLMLRKIKVWTPIKNGHKFIENLVYATNNITTEEGEQGQRTVVSLNYHS